MKTITITGKKNQDKINQVECPIREEAGKYCFDIDTYNHSDQVVIINRLYLDDSFEFKCEMIKILNKKLQGYKSQDKIKNIWDEHKFITTEKTLEHLVSSKLQCHYCLHPILFLYDKVGEKKQWTLDRIDNTLGHINDNIVIACLECNVQRRNMNKDKFKFTKSLKIVRTS